MKTCRFCNQPILLEAEATTAPSYWQGLPLDCHRVCREPGIRQEALECQTIDADCNDCRDFKRGAMPPVRISLTKTPDGRTVEVRYQAQMFSGHCLKFDRPTQAFPNKWTGRDCFTHRRAAA